ncbi:unnamed protein product, partial [Mesorhabditis spiculigera]
MAEQDVEAPDPEANEPQGPQAWQVPYYELANELWHREMENWPGKALDANGHLQAFKEADGEDKSQAPTTTTTTVGKKKPKQERKLDNGECQLIGDFVNPWDQRTWRVLGMRIKRLGDGLYTEYDVIRMPHNFKNLAGETVEEPATHERVEHVLRLCREDDKAIHDRFYHEAKVMMEMRERYHNYRQSRHFPAALGMGRFQETCWRGSDRWAQRFVTVQMDVPRPWFIMERLDPTLDHVIKAHPNNLVSLATACYMTIGMLKALRLLHEAGYCHRRVSPQAFGLRLPLHQMLNRNEAELSNYVVLTDLGVARKYQELPPRRLPPFTGTIKYSSPNAMEMNEQTAVDDVISVFYILRQMVTTTLPWVNQLNLTHTRDEVIKLKRMSHADQTLQRELTNEDRARQAFIKEKKANRRGPEKLEPYNRLFELLTPCNGLFILPPYEALICLLRQMTDRGNFEFTVFGIQKTIDKQRLKLLHHQKDKMAHGGAKNSKTPAGK